MISYCSPDAVVLTPSRRRRLGKPALPTLHAVLKARHQGLGVQGARKLGVQIARDGVPDPVAGLGHLIVQRQLCGFLCRLRIRRGAVPGRLAPHRQQHHQQRCEIS
jgi:hypothetical protein